MSGGIIGRGNKSTSNVASGFWYLREQYRSAQIAEWPFAAARYVRWKILSVRSGISGELMQASEFVLQNGGVDISMSGTTVTASDAGQAGEVPSNLVDTLTTNKFCSLIYTSPWVFTFDLGSEKIFNGYRWATAGDATGRDPASWTVEISNDNLNWALKSTITGYVATTTRQVYVGPWTFT